jgi:hypothetical protein
VNRKVDSVLFRLLEQASSSGVKYNRQIAYFRCVANFISCWQLLLILAVVKEIYQFISYKKTVICVIILPIETA